MVDHDDPLDVMQLHRGAKIVPERLVPALNAGATTPTLAPAMTKWLYFPDRWRPTRYRRTGSCRRGSMQDNTIAS
jgi:hypothetical protein